MSIKINVDAWDIADAIIYIHCDEDGCATSISTWWWSGRLDLIDVFENEDLFYDTDIFHGLPLEQNIQVSIEFEREDCGEYPSVPKWLYFVKSVRLVAVLPSFVQ